jgi:tetratricopeptide (TPR) repeat protein
MEMLAGSDHMYRDDMRAANACGLGDAKMHRGKPSEALIDYRRAWHIVQEYPRMLTRERAGVRALAGLASAYAAQGEAKQAGKLLAQAIESVDHCADGKTTNPVVPLPDLYLVLASAYARLDEHTLAVNMLDRAFKVGWRDAEWLKREPQLRPLSDDPRFIDILRAVQQFPPVHFELTSAEGREPTRGLP